jgi:GNAT superfamily N-acetyltransferase
MYGARVDIRPLSADDRPALLRLWDVAGLPIKSGGRDGAAAFATQLAFPGSCFLGAFEGDALVGAVLANHTGRKGWINRLAVDPARRRQGVARALVRAAEERLRAEGIRITAALIQADNATSLELFAALGYVAHDEVVYLSRRDAPEV